MKMFHSDEELDPNSPEMREHKRQFMSRLKRELEKLNGESTDAMVVFHIKDNGEGAERRYEVMQCVLGQSDDVAQIILKLCSEHKDAIAKFLLKDCDMSQEAKDRIKNALEKRDGNIIPFPLDEDKETRH